MPPNSEAVKADVRRRMSPPQRQSVTEIVRAITWTLRAMEAPEPIKSEGSEISSIEEVVTAGTREGQPFRATHLFLISLCTTPEALLRLVRERLSGDD
jgi:hypothetical protein